VAAAWGSGTTEVEPVRAPDTIVRSLAIGSPADGPDAVELAVATDGSIEAIADETAALAIRRLAALEGVFAETAGGVTVAAVEAARRRGVIREGDEVVALVTGNGLKTPDARRFGLPEPAPARPGEPGLAPVIRPSLAAFEAWLEGRA
jgi:threonine synthase